MTDASIQSRLGWSSVVVLALVLGGVALALARHGADRARRPTVAQSSTNELPLPRGMVFAPGEQFATDSSADGGGDLWTFVRAGSSLRVQRWSVASSGISPQRASLIVSPPAGHLKVAVASWPGAKQALVLAAQQGRSVVVQVRRAVPPFAILAQAHTPAMSLKTGDVRSVFVDRSGRRSVELIVVDRPAKVTGVMRIRVLAGRPGFHAVTSGVQLKGVNSFPVAAWNLVVGGVNSATGDLLFISRTGPTSSGKIEVHALLSSAGYRGYGVQTPIDSPEGSGVDWSYALAHEPDGTPVLYGVDLASHLLMRFPL
jgi:hypothetical protein